MPQFEKGNTAGAKWTEEQAREVLTWMAEEIERNPRVRTFHQAIVEANKHFKHIEVYSSVLRNLLKRFPDLKPVKQGCMDLLRELNRKPIQIIKNHDRLGSGYVYIMKCGEFNYYKIGISKNSPEKRWSGIQSGCPFPISFVSITYCEDYVMLERRLHEKYRSQRLMGEWFELSDLDLIDVHNNLKETKTKQVTLF